jgi:hypothetical protein
MYLFFDLILQKFELYSDISDQDSPVRRKRACVSQMVLEQAAANEPTKEEIRAINLIEVRRNFFSA